MAGLQQVDVVDAQALQIAIHGRLDVRARDARLPVRPQVLVPVPRHLRRRTGMTDPEVRLQTRYRVLSAQLPCLRVEFMFRFRLSSALKAPLWR